MIPTKSHADDNSQQQLPPTPATHWTTKALPVRWPRLRALKDSIKINLGPHQHRPVHAKTESTTTRTWNMKSDCTPRSCIAPLSNLRPLNKEDDTSGSKKAAAATNFHRHVCFPARHQICWSAEHFLPMRIVWAQAARPSHVKLLPSVHTCKMSCLWAATGSTLSSFSEQLIDEELPRYQHVIRAWV